MSYSRFFADDPNPPWATGFLLAALSDAVYEIGSSARHGRYALLGFEEQETFFHRLLAFGDLEASILRSENVVVVAIRGTEAISDSGGIIDMLSDADIATIPFFGVTFIHGGIARLATLFLPEIIRQLGAMPEIEEIWLTGHSLGGAVAQAVGFGLHVSHPIAVRRVVTFGAPRIGGALKWAVPAEASGFRVDRWVNGGDVVPRVPSTGVANPLDPRTWKPVIWKHYGRLNYIDWEAATVFFDDDKLLGPLIDLNELSFSDHRMVSYKHRIFDLVPAGLKAVMVDSLTAELSTDTIFRRAHQDLEELGRPTPITSLRELAATAPPAGSGSLLRTMALRYL